MKPNNQNGKNVVKLRIIGSENNRERNVKCNKKKVEMKKK